MDGVLHIKPMTEAPGTETEVAMVFVDSYYNELASISTNKEKLVRIFRPAFVKEAFYVAIMDGSVAGIMACSDNAIRAIHIHKDDLTENLGLIKGNLAYKRLQEQYNIPINYDDDTAYIESVATNPLLRRKGIATRLLEHVIRKLPYREFRLTVNDTNKDALSIYEKLGFIEVDRMKAGFFERKRFKYRIYMKLDKSYYI